MRPMMYAPPPPPPPPAPHAATMPPAALPATVMLPPPPPPAEPSTVFPPSQLASTPIGPPPSTSSGLFTMTQPHLSLPEKFDPTQPPPMMAENTKMKRKMEPSQAGPNKTRACSEANLPDSPCENCVQREIRIDLYKNQMDKLHSEGEHQSLLYKKKLEKYESGREYLRSLVDPELFRLLEDYIEGTPLALQQSSFVSGMSTVPRQLLLQLVEYVARKEAETNPSPVGVDDTALLQSLLRRSNVFTKSPSPERVHTSVLEMIRSESVSSTGSNGVRFNGQKESPSQPGAAVSNGGGPRYPPAPGAACRAFAPPPGPPPPFYLSGPPPPAPPARPYYPPSQPYGPTANPPFPNLGYNPGRGTAPASPQMPMRPTSTVAPSYNQFMMARYPHPPQYYPPFQ